MFREEGLRSPGSSPSCCSRAVCRSVHWPTSKRTDLGLEARLSVLQDRFSVGMGVRQLAGADLLRNWFAFLAVSDVNGMIYWLTPWKSKSP